MDLAWTQAHNDLHTGLGGGSGQVQATLTCLARLQGQVSVTRLSR